MAFLRQALSAAGVVATRDLAALPDGATVRVAGHVIVRQRPGTAKGFCFLTLEDETGCANVVVWASLAERQRKALLDARLLGVQGVIERDGEVVHLVAQRLEDHSALLDQLHGRLAARSRDFH